ncbi:MULTISPECIES: CAP domain-containing protein [Aeromicrobium]|uniref:CAP domain-containing protein n=1 Tax=Aeromicrobium TaxID=2040 RepID=UPI00257B4E1D|nr:MULTISPECIES: CAP domain-containing protein [Aeromicrobium]
MRHILSAFLVALALVVVPAAPQASAMSNATFGKKLHQQTNTSRAFRDIKKLKYQKCIDRYAQRQANRMAKKRKIYHQDLGPILRACDLSRVGENVATGFTSPKANVKAWLKSPGHRRNMLNRKYTRLGIGVAKAGGRTYTVQVFGRPA